MTHLDCLQLRLSNERIRLGRAKNAAEIALRRVWVRQMEREIAGEYAHIGIIEPIEIDEETLFNELSGLTS